MRALVLILAGLAAAPALAQDGECVDYAEHVSALKALEPVAIRGDIDAATVTCLELGYVNARSQTDKGKISRVLMANAYVTDSAQWARLVKRHLDEVEQSDPDIAYLYANYLYNQPNPDYGAVIRAADLAYERRADRWEGEVYTVRSHHLLRLRTVARIQLWRKGEEAAAGGGDAARVRADELRLQAHASAREWLDFDRASEVSWLQAAEVCVSTASEQACGLRPGWQQQAALVR